MHLHAIALAEDRAAELAQERRRPGSSIDRGPRLAPVRRATARLLVAISLASAAAVRRLDACLADDLPQRLAAPDGA